ncbi:matrix metalloproteinase-19-like isoform X1 [Watersipora subatra]|uniref:matrix metalloproteinase-19-like isoform X1 n=1 Tax=Watersipora subatra TaxID=2589382 RepID=UPI00355B3AFD
MYSLVVRQLAVWLTTLSFSGSQLLAAPRLEVNSQREVHETRSPGFRAATCNSKPDQFTQQIHPSIPSSSVPANFRLSGGQYGKTVTWTLDKPAKGLPVDAQRKAFNNAFKYWSDVADIDITESDTNLADIHISFETRDHGDGYAFDGRDGVLAHAFFPKDGRVHFDDEESWTVDSPKGKNLELVAIHEFGHTLGLQHSEVWGAVMSPYFQGNIPDFELHEDDVKAITYLYGARPSARVVDNMNSPNTCKMKFDDIVRLPEQRYYVFRRQWVYKLNAQGAGVESGWPKLSKSLYEDFPNSADAITYSHLRHRLYAFKDNRVWRYYKKKLEQGFPAEILKNSTSILSTFAWKDGLIYGLSARDVHRFDEDTFSWIWISSLRELFPDAPYGSEAAVWNHQDSLYLFKGSRFYNVDDNTNLTRKGYPQSKHALWLGCPQL